MIHVKTKNINIENDKLNCIIEYPEMHIEEENIFLQKVNNKINEEVNIFLDIERENVKVYNEKLNIFVNYKVYFNKNNIFSMSILFSEFYRNKNLINYVSTYNFDLNEEKIINIQDLLKEKSGYKSILSKILNEDIYEIQNFYIEDKSFNLIFSSYEIYDKTEVIEKKINFKDIYNYLNEYAIREIMN